MLNLWLLCDFKTKTCEAPPAIYLLGLQKKVLCWKLLSWGFLFDTSQRTSGSYKLDRPILLLCKTLCCKESKNMPAWWSLVETLFNLFLCYQWQNFYFKWDLDWRFEDLSSLMCVIFFYSSGKWLKKRREENPPIVIKFAFILNGVYKECPMQIGKTYPWQI